MTKRPLLFIFYIAFLALTGCVSGPTNVVQNKPTELAFPPPPEEAHFYFERSLRSSADVLPDDDSNLFKRALTGEQRKGEGLAKPYAIAAHHGRIYVGDSLQHCLIVFDIPGKKFFKIGLEEDEDGNGKLSQPLGLDIDKQGNVYVLDAKLKKVIVYDPDGKYLRSFGDNTMLYKPAGLGVTADGTRVYAVDIGGSSSNEHKIVVFNGITGERLPNIGKRGTEPGEFNLPRDVTVAPDGSIYVIDGGNFRVQKFDKDGKFVSTFGSIGRQSGQFSRPKEGAVDPQGNVYVVDSAFGNFQIFDPTGQMLMSIGHRSNTNGPGLYSLPAGIAVDDDGRIYFVDQFFRKVDVFRPAALAANGGWIGPFNPKKPSSELNPDAKTQTDSQPAPPVLAKDAPTETVKDLPVEQIK